MAEGERKELDLTTVCNGRAPLVFQRLLEQVMENIRDPNFKATDKRKITLEFTFVPHKKRAEAKVSIATKLKLAELEPEESHVFMAHRGDHTVATTHDTRQEELLPDEGDGELDDGKKKLSVR